MREGGEGGALEIIGVRAGDLALSLQIREAGYQYELKGYITGEGEGE